MAKNENKEIKKAIDIIDEMSMNEKEWELYWSRKFAIMDYNSGMLNAQEKGLREGREKGMKEGIKEGIKEGKMQDAKELLKLGMSIEDIQKVTKLTKEEIEKLRK